MLTEEQKKRVVEIRSTRFLGGEIEKEMEAAGLHPYAEDLKHPGLCIGRSRTARVSQYFLECLEVGGVEAMNFSDLCPDPEDFRHRTEAHFPNYNFGKKPKLNDGVKFSMPSSKYTMCQSAPSEGATCDRCNQHNPHAGPNLGSKYICYQCR